MTRGKQYKKKVFGTFVGKREKDKGENKEVGNTYWATGIDSSSCFN